jgi:hypothetical protein
MVLGVVQESGELFGGRLFSDARVLGAAVLGGQEWPGVKLGALNTDMMSGLPWRRRDSAEGSVGAAGDFAD